MALYFSFGTPVDERHFFNREREIQTITQRIALIKKGARNDIALLGPRRIGKSSLLNLLQKKLEKRGFIVLRIDCEGLDLESFLNELGNQVIAASIQNKKLSQRFLVQIRKSITDSISILAEMLGRVSVLEIKKSNEFLSFRLEIEKSRQQKRMQPEDREALFRKTLESSENLQKKCIIMLDEFQETAAFSLNGRNFFANFRNITQHQKNTSYIFTGSSLGMMREIFGNPENPLAGNAEIIQLRPFEHSSAVKFLEKGLQTAKIKIDSGATEFIVKKTGGFPSYLNWMGLQFIETRKEKITIKEAENTFHKILLPASPIFQMIQKQLIKLGQKTLKLLKVIAQGIETPSGMAQYTAISNIYVYLDRLQMYGIIEKKENFYKIIDPVLKEYLQKI